LFRSGDAASGVAHLSALLRRDPSNHVAASRLVSALVHRNWALPAALPMRHLDRVATACFSPAGRRVVTGSLDRTARIWDASTGQALTPALKHDSPVTQICFSPDGQRISTACWNRTVRLWDATTGTTGEKRTIISWPPDQGGGPGPTGGGGY
jgi:WD40 repeat protein